MPNPAERRLLIQATANSPQGVGLASDRETGEVLWLCIHKGWLREMRGADYFLLTNAGRRVIGEKELANA